MEFRLLGLLEVTGDDGRSIGIVRGHESGLLALLLLHANEALSAERIVDDLWAGTPGLLDGRELDADDERKARQPDRPSSLAP